MKRARDPRSVAYPGDLGHDRDGAPPHPPAWREPLRDHRDPDDRPAPLLVALDPAVRREPRGRLPAPRLHRPRHRRDMPGEPRDLDGVRPVIRRPEAAGRLAAEP